MGDAKHEPRIQIFKNLRLNGDTSYESQTRNYITCFGNTATILTAKRTIDKNT